MSNPKAPKEKSPPKQQINVRVEQKLYDLILADALEGERKATAQVRLVLKKHYRARLDQQPPPE